MALGDIISGDQPIRVDVSAESVMAALKENAITILLAIYIMLVLAFLTGLLIQRSIFK